MTATDAHPVTAAAALPPSTADAPSTPGAAARSPRWQAVRFTVVSVGLGLLPLAGAVVTVRGLPPVSGMDWTLALDQRSAAAAAAVTGRKVVFIGGSNVRFGVDAPGLTRDLGLPVINYGLHASLGIDVIADRAARCVGRGDVVVFAPELSHFKRSTVTDSSDDLRMEFLATHPSPNVDRRAQAFPAKQWRRARSQCNRLRASVEETLASTVEAAWGGPRGATATPYTVDAVGPDGSIVFPRPAPLPLARWSYSKPPASVSAMGLSPTGSRGGVAFELLRQTCQARGATLCVMAPLRVSVDHLDQATLAAEERAWVGYATAHGAVAVLAAGSNVLPPADGYDTDYHLNDTGEAIARGRIATALRPIVAAGPVVATSR